MATERLVRTFGASGRLGALRPKPHVCWKDDRMLSAAGLIA